MAAFSTLNHFGVNFGNEDVMRRVSFFLNQRDKIALSTSSRRVHQALKHFLPTASEYVTTVKPNLLPVPSSDNGVYVIPVGMFNAQPDGFFDSFIDSMIVHTGCNEEKDYYLAWFSYRLFGKTDCYRSPRHIISLEFPSLHIVEEALIIQRLRDSVDRQLRDHDFFPYTPRILDAVESNTSIVEIVAHNNDLSCRCDLFECLSRRSTDIESLMFWGESCADAYQAIADGCVQGLKKLTIASNPGSDMDGDRVDTVCEAVSEVGILESLEIDGAIADYDGGGDGLVRVLDTCPLRSLSVNASIFGEDAWSEMVRVLSNMKATDVKFTELEIFRDWMRPAFDALFSNTSIQSLDLSFTNIGDGSIGALENMVKRGTLIKLGIRECSIGRDGNKSVLRATTHVDSNLRFISISDTDHPDIFAGLVNTSLEVVHLEVSSDAAIESLAKLNVAKRESGRASLETLNYFRDFQNLVID
ncbi:unnamed protein product [Ectocarpus sp. 8 AP-2014]